MNIIKLNAIDSTNSYLKKMAASGGVSDNTVVVSDEQTSGRGQMGTVWRSEPGKNLTFSLFKEIRRLQREEQFYLSMAVSLGILKGLETFDIPSLRIKWPNDILSGNAKICGILIENIFKENQMRSSVIGIGLNVNQLDFEDLLNASSMKRITGIHYNRDEVMQRIIKGINEMEQLVENRELGLLKSEYESMLFRREKPSTFKKPDGALIMGFIEGVDTGGKLVIRLEDEVRQRFDLKEITLLY
ncbi:biotin--[acetyl-CoA-carboxylase] ligase [Robertkochia aurantiaca]|uniref:biotin--[acetyl-CoA-carboxylase] ligase n=1 Tax=Robertkochia aurantiaca TaxID=2873700 RepID=UPI001CC9912C|nr:biotin--[acetyl-CoA-carboxylase] ligase [Robertkochia sp. 3YJGBD-33]